MPAESGAMCMTCIRNRHQKNGQFMVPVSGACVMGILPEKMVQLNKQIAQLLPRKPHGLYLLSGIAMQHADDGYSRCENFGSLQNF